jgi:hypothetical protein
MEKLYVWRSSVGLFYIMRINTSYYPLYDGQLLGRYAKPQDAANDLSGGCTDPLDSGLDTARLGIPSDLTEWKPLDAEKRPYFPDIDFSSASHS